MPFRFAFDQGTDSLGWAVLRLDDQGELLGLEDWGAVIATDGRNPKDGSSLAVKRRIARSSRRRRDRLIYRQNRLLRLLIQAGLMPADPLERAELAKLDPWPLRAKAASAAISPHEFGRVLFHLNQRRGFKATRSPTDRAAAANKEDGKIAQGIQRLDAALGGQTLGQYLAQQTSRRARPRRAGAGIEYPLYPSRAMVEAEFATLWDVQAQAAPALLTEDLRQRIHHRIFHQRPLKPVERGWCSLVATDKREPSAMPLAQQIRILQELANLRLTIGTASPRPLTRAEHAKLLDKLRTSKEVTFEAIRKLLKLPGITEFNLECEGRTGLKGDLTAHRLASKNGFGKAWYNLPLADQSAIVTLLLNEPDEEQVLTRLQAGYGLSEAAALAVSRTALPDGESRYGPTALGKIVPLLADPDHGWRRDGDGPERPLRLDEAIPLADATWHHSDRRTGEIDDHLPYYGQVLDRHVIGGKGQPNAAITDPMARAIQQYGRFPNPTVHVGLNQLAKLVNDLIARYGPPAEIVLELARELKQSAKEREKASKNNADNRRDNDRRRNIIEDARKNDANLKITGERLLRLRLWEELGKDEFTRICIYSPKNKDGSDRVISLEMALSDKTEIDHILPFSKTWDNSTANLLLCIRGANREKRSKSPADAFRHSPDWPDIQARAARLPPNKRWRFNDDAMTEQERGFLDRQLAETRYLARISKAYLERICDPDRIRVIPGKLTALLRHAWGLDGILGNAATPRPGKKNRNDHRHHAVDALVIGCTSQSLLQQIATLAGELETDEAERERGLLKAAKAVPLPWPGFNYEALRQRAARLVVHHKAEHGIGGELHEQTAYGPIDPKTNENCNLVFRKPLENLTAGEIDHIRDLPLRAAIQAATAGITDKKALAAALATFGAAQNPPIRRVRVLTKDQTAILLKDRQGKPYKAVVPGENHHVDVWRLPNGKVVGVGVSLFDAQPNKPQSEQRPHPAARKLMRLHKGDIIRAEMGGEIQLLRVVRLEITNQRIRVCGINDSGDLQKRHEDPDDPYRWIYLGFNTFPARKVVKVVVTRLGGIRQPPQG